MKNDNQPNEKSIGKTVDVTKYIFHAPNPNQFLFIILIIGILLGFGLTFDLNDPAANFESDKLTSSILGYGIIAIALPAIISALISRPLAESLGGRFYHRRSVLLAVVAILVFSLIMIICKILTIFIRLELTVILIFGYSAIFFIRHSVLVGTSNHNHLNSLPASLNHSILGFAMVIILPAIASQITAITLLSPEYTITMNELLYMTGFCVIFIITTILWTTIISGPLKKNYNVNGPELAALALGQFTEQNKRDIEGLEKF
ncbi:MAG: DUF2070 family protein, partial [Thermoplasmata archaeon]|nr:DUF2070 family protein [Thermoplasmata archaeon]